ncbi:MAG: hypothetical protein ACI8TX_000531 [Hyphomicrobiaceae bacterium]|jgi:hypothetical protein
MLDHLIYIAPDLDHAVAALKARLGVRPAAGGSHPGLGTRNALLALGADTYLEVLAPDPAQAGASAVFDFASLTQPRLGTWAAKAIDIDARVERAANAGYDAGLVVPMERRLPDNTVLEWRLTWRSQPEHDGLVPFLIDWGDSPSPATSAPTGCSLSSFYAEHPNPSSVQPVLSALEVDLDVRGGEHPALVAIIDGPKGRFELR